MHKEKWFLNLSYAHIIQDQYVAHNSKITFSVHSLNPTSSQDLQRIFIAILFDAHHVIKSSKIRKTLQYILYCTFTCIVIHSIKIFVRIYSTHLFLLSERIEVKRQLEWFSSRISHHSLNFQIYFKFTSRCLKEANKSYLKRFDLVTLP